jgi:hypothetical protein
MVCHRPSGWKRFSAPYVAGGELPHRRMGNLDNLDYLNMTGIELRGPIPAELGHLANLEWLTLLPAWLVAGRNQQPEAHRGSAQAWNCPSCPTRTIAVTKRNGSRNGWRNSTRNVRGLLPRPPWTSPTSSPRASPWKGHPYFSGSLPLGKLEKAPDGHLPVYV